MPSEAVDVVAGLLVRDGKALVTQRPHSAPRGGQWEFPGGKVDPGESPQNALCRELREELGIRTRVGKKWASRRHDYPEISIHLHLYQASLEGGEPAPLQCLRILWATPEELKELAISDADRGILETLTIECFAGKRANSG